MAHYALAGGGAYGAGSQSDAEGASSSFVGGGLAAGVAGFFSEAQAGDGGIPQTFAVTHGSAGGGDLLTSQTGTMSGDLLFGQTPISSAASVTFVGAYDPAPSLSELGSQDAFSTVGDPTFGHIA